MFFKIMSNSLKLMVDTIPELVIFVTGSSAFDLKNSLFIMSLLRLIAFQIGNDVSHNELADTLGVSKNTVARYLDFIT